MNILIAGVGGQGTLLASRVLGNYAGLMGYDCKLSEVHGMAQRGGSVITYVKFGEKIHSPVIADGDSDVLLAFEELEALRWSHNVKKGGKLLMNTQKIMPLPVIIGASEYPENIIDTLKKGQFDFYGIDALGIAKACGNEKALNTVMIGYFAKVVGIDRDILKKALEMSVPAKFAEVNIKAFEAGYNA